MYTFRAPRILCRCSDKETADRQKNCPSEKLWSNHVTVKMSSISDLKRPTAPKILDSLNKMMQRTANENAAGLRRICKRSFTDPTPCIIIFSEASQTEFCEQFDFPTGISTYHLRRKHGNSVWEMKWFIPFHLECFRDNKLLASSMLFYFSF